jgi:hypothetical protein
MCPFIPWFICSFPLLLEVFVPAWIGPSLFRYLSLSVIRTFLNKKYLVSQLNKFLESWLSFQYVLMDHFLWAPTSGFEVDAGFIYGWERDGRHLSSLYGSFVG